MSKSGTPIIHYIMLPDSAKNGSYIWIYLILFWDEIEDQYHVIYISFFSVSFVTLHTIFKTFAKSYDAQSLQYPCQHHCHLLNHMKVTDQVWKGTASFSLSIIPFFLINWFSSCLEFFCLCMFLGNILRISSEKSLVGYA